MGRYKFFVLGIISIIFCDLNTVVAQNPTDILGIFDMLGIDPQDFINNLGQLNTEQICNDIRNSSGEDLCTRQLKIICENELFMSRMLDAASKFPYTGTLVKTRIDYGSYDECIDLDLTENGVRVIGKHCTGGLVIPTTELNDTEFFEKAYKLSICIPDGCSAQELMAILNASTDLPLINDVSCSTKESWKMLGADDYAVLAFLLIVVIIMTISTGYDVYLYYTNQECPHVLLQAFSVYCNGKKLLKVSKGPSDQIKAIHGLKVISMIWIISGHSFGTMTRFPGINIDFPIMFEWTRRSTYITTAHMAVDTFFFISGFLLSYQYLKQEPKPLKTHVKRIPYLYLHRYLRITPAMAAAFLITITIISHMGNGPIYDSIKVEKDMCLNHWWSFFLYVQNYVNYDEVCLINSWYLSADWQLFVIAPIVLIPVALSIRTNFRWVIGQLFLLNIFLTVAPIGLKFILNDFDNEFETHAFINVYFIGFMLGVFMREKSNQKYPFNALGNIVMWLIVLLTMLLTMLIYKEIQLLAYYRNDPSYFSYFILLRVFWSLGLSWIIYSCHNGYGGFINWLLTTPLVQVLSKLTYSMYITHVCPVMYFRLTSRLPIVYSQETAITETIVHYFVTLLISVFWTLAFESPLIILEKYFLGTKR